MRVKKKVGAPKAKLDWEEIDNFLIAGCSGQEVAGYCGVNPATIYDRCLTDNGMSFSEYSQRKKAKGNSMLRAKQFEQAIVNEDTAMQIWLGKNRLDQSDKKETKVDLSGNIEIDI